MVKKVPSKRKISTKTIGKELPELVSELPPELTKDEALTPGVLKLLLREQDKSARKITELEKKTELLLREKAKLIKENAVLKTKRGYSLYWDILIGLAGISGGGAVTFWYIRKEVSILCGVMTIVLLVVVIAARRK